MSPQRSESSPDALKAALAQRVREAGFDLFGVAPAERFEEDLHRFQKWLGKGFNAGMAYLSRQPSRRADPQSFLAGARSLVVVGMVTPRPSDRPDSEGRIARYARTRDYHLEVTERLERVTKWLEKEVSSRPVVRSFVDAQPILERAVARAAGLGFVGRNTCLIHPDMGSRFVIGGFATDLALPRDQPLDPGAGCGECRRCLDACPTGALAAPYQLDARRCLSYLTIEHRGDLPDDLAEAMGACLFGCDACQDACSYNAREPETLRSVEMHDRVESLTLSDVLETPSNRVFQEAFGDTALARCRRSGIVRNALIVAANLGRRDLVDRVRSLASRREHSDVVRERAAETLRVLEVEDE